MFARNFDSEDIIMSALPFMVKTYSNTLNVPVRAVGKVAMTNKEMVIIPALPNGYSYPKALYGFLAHEAAHVRFTDFTVRYDSNLHKRLTNTLEDGRIELAIIKVLPGTSSTLDLAAKMFMDMGKLAIPSSEMADPIGILKSYLLYWMRYQWRGQTFLKDHYEAALANFKRHFSRGIQVRLSALLKEVPDCQTTLQIAIIARRILTMIEQQLEEESKPPSPSEGNQSEAAQAEQGGDPQSGSSNQAPSSDPSGDKSPSGEKGSNTDSEGNAVTDHSDLDSNGESKSGKTKGKPRSQSQISKDAVDAANAAAALLERIKKGDVGEEASGQTDVFDQIQKELNTLAAADPNSGNEIKISNPVGIKATGAVDPALEQKAEFTSGFLRRHLSVLVQAANRTTCSRANHGRRVDPQQVYRLGAWDLNVFRDVRQRPMPNTAVHILVDASGSMKSLVGGVRTRIEIANESAYAIALGLQQIPGANPAVTYFKESGNTVSVVLPHDQRINTTRPFLAQRAGGDTPMGQALWYALGQLAKVRQPRRMIVVISDGIPDSIPAVQQAISLADQAGIEVMAIGIGANYVKNLFQKAIVISDPSELQEKLFELVRNALLNY